MTPVFEIKQGIQVMVRADNDGSTAASIAAVGSPFGDKFLPSKTDAAVSAVSGFDAYPYLIDELHIRNARGRRNRTTQSLEFLGAVSCEDMIGEQNRLLREGVHIVHNKKLIKVMGGLLP